MAKARRSSSNGGEAGARVAAEEKIARLLAMLLVKDIKVDAAKVPLLTSAGFTTSEIAELLGTTDATVRVAINRTRKKKKR